MIRSVTIDIFPDVRNLFSNHRPSFLINAVLQGYGGQILVGNTDKPLAAMITFGDIVTLGGDSKSNSSTELIGHLPVEKGILPLPKDWLDQLERIFGDRLVRLPRYKFSGELLDLEELQRIKHCLPDCYKLTRIDVTLASKIFVDRQPHLVDHVTNFESPERFFELGFGFCVMKSGEIISIASTYAVCNEGIEIQVNTKDEYRGQGLAAAASAALIIESIHRGLVPNWDAANQVSARLAERLGYRSLGMYDMHLLLPTR